MPATVEIMRWNGSGSGTPTKITNLNTRANAEDTNTTASVNNPIQIPPTSATTSYSYWVCTRLQCTPGFPPANGIANLRWYSDGTNNFSGNSSIGCIGNEATAYSQATGVAGTGNLLTQAAYGQSNALTPPVDVFSGFPGGIKNMGGALPGGSTGDFGNWFVYQISVAYNALPGASGQETFTWKYDET